MATPVTTRDRSVCVRPRSGVPAAELLSCGGARRAPCRRFVEPPSRTRTGHPAAPIPLQDRDLAFSLQCQGHCGKEAWAFLHHRQSSRALDCWTFRGQIRKGCDNSRLLALVERLTTLDRGVALSRLTRPQSPAPRASTTRRPMLAQRFVPACSRRLARSREPHTPGGQGARDAGRSEPLQGPPARGRGRYLPGWSQRLRHALQLPALRTATKKTGAQSAASGQELVFSPWGSSATSSAPIT